MPVKTSVIVTTYNMPKALDLVLYGLSLQKTHAAEIVIADDGSGAETKNLINKWSMRTQVPLKHVWHEDKGNRKLVICNKAVDASSGDYLIFLDGDSIPHHLWISDHLDAAREHSVLCGRRVKLGPEISRSIDREFIQSGKLESISGAMLRSAIKKDTRRFMLGIRLPTPFARFLHPTERRLMGVNFSLHKALFSSVGGYAGIDNKIVSSEERVREDAKLEIDLLRAGARRYPLINRGIVYHLHHRERIPSKESDQFIQDHYQAALQQRKAITK